LVGKVEAHTTALVCLWSVLTTMYGLF